jgi:phage FluMu protein Com
MHRAGYGNSVSGVRQETFDVECPHCHERFAAAPIEGGRAARYLGFKCPHCKLFVPLRRATDSGRSRKPDSAS